MKKDKEEELSKYFDKGMGRQEYHKKQLELL